MSPTNDEGLGLLAGAYDLHLHAAPEIFPRRGNAADYARRAHSAGMAGILVKSHHEGTVAAALLARAAVPEVDVAGSITLNRFVGGINPAAVAAALETGARAVFMPSMQSRRHLEEFGSSSYGIDGLTLPLSLMDAAGDGVTVFDAEQRLTSDSREVIRLVAEHGAYLGTSHLSPAEIRAVVAEAKLVGARVLITHALHVPTASAGFFVDMADEGALIEVTAHTLSPTAAAIGHGATLEEAVQLITAVGHERVVIATDGGQPSNPWPVELLAGFVTALRGAGILREELGIMMRRNPRRMLGLD
jgi:hypothetical protein